MNIKAYRSDSDVEKLRIRQKFEDAAKNFDRNSASSSNILNGVFEFRSGNTSVPTRKKKEHHFKVPSISREENLSCASQNDTYKSFTEFKLNELYHESKRK